MIEVSSGASKVVQPCPRQVVVGTDKYFLHIFIVHTHFLYYIFFNYEIKEQVKIIREGIADHEDYSWSRH